MTMTDKTTATDTGSDSNIARAVIYMLGILAAVTGLIATIYASVVSPTTEPVLAELAARYCLPIHIYKLLHYSADLIVAVAYTVIAWMLWGFFRRAVRKGN